MTSADSFVVDCPHCRAHNRVLTWRFNESPTCGECGRELLSGAALALSEENFAPVIGASTRPVVVDFWAGWCAPCKAFAPVFAAKAAKTPTVLFAKVDTDANPNLTSRYAIKSIPTVALFRDGRFEDRVSGALPADQFDAWLRAALR